MISPFIRRRHGHEKAAVPHPDMWPALRRTYGVILYQEQVIEVASAIAGFSLTEADTLRRTMTHDRSMEEMDELGRLFVEKAAARGVPRAAADEVFRQLRGFAAYGFNKAHAACFAVICNTSAWLKAHYPAEFFCGLLNNQPMGFYSPRVVVNDARRWGLEVLPVDVNASLEGFSVERDGHALRVGLRYVKEMSRTDAATIVRERDDAVDRASAPPDASARSEATGTAPRAPYASLADFCRRTRVSIEIVENLVRVGAFDASRRAPRRAARAGAGRPRAGHGRARRGGRQAAGASLRPGAAARRPPRRAPSTPASLSPSPSTKSCRRSRSCPAGASSSASTPSSRCWASTSRLIP